MLSDYMEPFILLEPTDTPAPDGGLCRTWGEALIFQGGLTAVMAVETDLADQQARRLSPVLLHEWGVTLRQGDLVQRQADGAFFRVAGHSSDMRTPLKAGFAFAQVPVERLVTAP